MRVEITRLARTPTQSGLRKNNLWVLTSLEERKTRSISDITGWTGCDDSRQQIEIKFKSKEDAILYATDQNFDFVINDANDPTLKVKSYSHNFTKKVL